MTTLAAAAHAALPTSAPRCKEAPQWKKASRATPSTPTMAPNPPDHGSKPLHTTMSAASSSQSVSLVNNVLTPQDTRYIVEEADLEAALRKRYPGCKDFKISVRKL